MATRRRPIHSTNSGLNFRPQSYENKTENRGTKPTSRPASVKEILTLMVLHLCKKSLFFNTNLKVALYLGALFLISLIADFAPVPKSYLSRSDNIFNQYFVKFAWAWNLLLLIPFVSISSYIYCCTEKQKVFLHHISRILIATGFWWFWTTFFNIIEASYGKCSAKSFSSKQACLKDGHYWNGFDISGHSFILIYGSLVLIEEARSLVNWDTIKEHIRNEKHYRITRDTSFNSNPLKQLSDIQLHEVSENYNKYTIYVRVLFIGITLLQILWDVMLVCTMLYYHIMVEKFLGGAAAILTWYFTYKVWFSLPKVLPKLPGEGAFKYIKSKTKDGTIKIPDASSGRLSFSERGQPETSR